MFLDPDEVAMLTGRKFKGHQIDALRKMGIPFFVNAAGRAIVTRVAVEGRLAPIPAARTAWVPPGLRTK